MRLMSWRSSRPDPKSTAVVIKETSAEGMPWMGSVSHANTVMREDDHHPTRPSRLRLMLRQFR